MESARQRAYNPKPRSKAPQAGLQCTGLGCPRPGPGGSTLLREAWLPCELCQRVAMLEDRADTHAAMIAVLAVIAVVLLIRSGALPKLSALVAAVHA